jgi:hypothetical protein
MGAGIAREETEEDDAREILLRGHQGLYKIVFMLGSAAVAL